MKYTLILLVFAVISHAYADTNSYIFVGGYSSDEDERGGAEIGMLTFLNDSIAISVTGNLYDNGSDAADSGVFAGYGISGLWTSSSELIKPYLGAGFFMGRREDQDESRDNSTSVSYNDSDDYDYSTAPFAEGGIMLTSEVIFLKVFSRRYFDNNAEPKVYDAWGVAVGWQY